jgi:hypothetical protein
MSQLVTGASFTLLHLFLCGGTVPTGFRCVTDHLVYVRFFFAPT